MMISIVFIVFSILVKMDDGPFVPFSLFFFYEFIANGFDKWLNENKIKKPAILFVDGHRSHLSLQLSTFCDDNQILLYCLPPNTTHIM